ncbi:MAG: hypothetical protein FVQ83_07930 [Chloroflexi bacterium]|nr:hypothetical protein [Chloroflexota bacterium]
MKPEWRRFAPIGLYIAILSGLISFALYFVNRNVDLPLQISLGLVVIGLGAFMILDPDRIRMAFSGRQARYGSNAFVLVLATFGILVVVNYIVYQNPKRWDLTEDRLNSLAPETIEILKALEEPVHAIAFFVNTTSQANFEQARDMLRAFQLFGDGIFDYEFIDPYVDIAAASAANLSTEQSMVLQLGERQAIVLQMGDRQEQISSATEQEIARGLYRLLSANEEDENVYFLTGHGERSLDQQTEVSYSLVGLALETKDYVVDSLDLVSRREIPEDADMIVIAGPQIPMTEAEVVELKEFMDSGGALVVLEDPILDTFIGDSVDPLADYLLEDWGVILGKDIIVDISTEYYTWAVADTETYANHAIIQKMLEGVTLFFPRARSVQIGDQVENVNWQVLVSTAPFDEYASWAESNLEGLASENPSPDEGEDILGSVPLAGVGENTLTGARLVVIGDSDFASNTYYMIQMNGDFLINAVDWAAEQEDLISISPGTRTERFLLPPLPNITRIIFLAAVVVVPGAVVVGGGVVWFLRRRQG